MTVLPELARAAYLALHGLGWVAVYTLAIGSLLGAATWLMLRLMRQRGAWARYALGCGALVLLAGVPLKVGVSIHGSFGGHDLLAEHIAAELMQEGVPAAAPVRGRLPGGWGPRDLMLAMEARHDGPDGAWIDGDGAQWLGAALATFGALWILLGSLGLARLVRDWRAVSRLRTLDTTPVDPRWNRALARVRKRVGVAVPVDLRVSPHINGPALIGWLRPAILVPPEPHVALTDREAEAILAHELAHVRRGDFAVNVLQTAIEAVLFWHPVAWWLGGRLRDEREYSSDDVAHRSIEGTLADYLRALVRLESLRMDATPEPSVAAAGGELLRRIRRLAEMAALPERPRLDVDVLLVAVCLIGLWLPILHVADLTRPASIAVMKHDLLMPRDFERIANEVAPMKHSEATP